MLHLFTLEVFNFGNVTNILIFLDLCLYYVLIFIKKNILKLNIP